MTYLGGFLGNFHNVSLVVTLYIKYVFTFQPDDVENVDIKKLRWKSLMWKFALTSSAILLNIAVPLSDQPLVFKLLTKGQSFERYNVCT